MKKCPWWRLCHYHKITGTERKIKPKKSDNKCQANSYLSKHYIGDCILVSMKMKCCNCDKIETIEILDFDTWRAMEYKDEE